MQAFAIVIGAGIVGLATGYELSKRHENVFVLEREARYGMHASSRNSGVVHSGVYYSSSNLPWKAGMCVQGNRMIYELPMDDVAYKRSGKLIVAQDGEERELEILKAQGEENGVEGLEIIDGKDVAKKEPLVKARAGLWVPSAGMINPDEFMKYYARRLGNSVLCGREVESIDFMKSGFWLRVRAGGRIENVTARYVINVAGAGADTVLKRMNVTGDLPEQHFCEGVYYDVPEITISMPVYPVHDQGSGGLGIHAIPDTSGRLRLGPNTIWVSRENAFDYQHPADADPAVSETMKQEFFESVHLFLPSLSYEGLRPGTVGVRAKLQEKGEPPKDFLSYIINNTNGVGKMISLLGIESPGLTAAPALAKDIADLIYAWEN